MHQWTLALSVNIAANISNGKKPDTGLARKFVWGFEKPEQTFWPTSRRAS